MAGVGNKYLRAFDLRQNATNPPINFPTRYVHGVTIDVNQNHITSCSDEGYMAIWDRRYAKAGNAQPVLDFPRLHDFGLTHRQNQSLVIHSLRFSKNRTGVFGVKSEVGILKVYQLGTQVDAAPDSEDSGAANRFQELSLNKKPESVVKESLFVTRVSERKHLVYVPVKNRPLTSFSTCTTA